MNNLIQTAFCIGIYLWSNGMSGSTIIVDHGGSYQVTFYPDGADCHAASTFTAPKSPDVYSWIFPTGCFEYCRDIKDFPYLIGPIPSFDGGYEYDLNGNTIAAGVGVVPDLPIAQGLDGGLTLTLNNSFCNITTDFLDITSKECEECDDLINVTEVDKIEDPTGYVYYNIIDGVIQNPYNLPVTITLFSQHGSFIPAVISIPPSGVYSFANNPVMFIPFSPWSGSAFVEFVINTNGGGENKILCLGTVNVNMDALQGFTGGGIVEMRVIPNPVESAAQVFYSVEDLPEFTSGIIKLYSLSGSLINSQKVNDTQGQASFDLNGLASGTYVVVFFSQTQRLGQQILIKQ